MPKTTRHGQAKQSELPSTLKKSDAKALNIRGRSTMHKKELVAAIEKENRRETRER